MTLGRDLAQCCGGVVELWLERLTRDDRRWLAHASKAARAGRRGAGNASHARRAAADLSRNRIRSRVQPRRLRNERAGTAASCGSVSMRPTRASGYTVRGMSVARSCAALRNYRSRSLWIDSRAELLTGSVPPNTRTWHAENPASMARQAPAEALSPGDDARSRPRLRPVPLHSHARRVTLARSHRVGEQGGEIPRYVWRGPALRRERIARLVCPIGVGGLTSKLPAAIAAGVTVQLLQELEHTAERALFRSNAPRASNAAVRATTCPC